MVGEKRQHAEGVAQIEPGDHSTRLVVVPAPDPESNHDDASNIPQDREDRDDSHSSISSLTDSANRPDPIARTANEQIPFLETVEEHQFEDATENSSLQRARRRGEFIFPISRICGPVCILLDRRDQPQRKRWRAMSLGTVAGAICLVLIILIQLEFNTSNHGHLAPPTRDNRAQKVLQCASKLSNQNITPPTEDTDPSIRWNVTQYFLSGPGQLVQPDCDAEDSLFVTLYSLITLRDSVKITHPTWNDDSYSVTSLLDVCSWTHIDCDGGASSGKRITGLTFNNVHLCGTIPPELQWIRSLKLLKLYTNSGLVGTLSSELGLLTNLEDLEFHETSLHGTIPTNLSRMTSLETFILYDTLVTGIMPEKSVLSRISSTAS